MFLPRHFYNDYDNEELESMGVPNPNRTKTPLSIFYTKKRFRFTEEQKKYVSNLYHSQYVSKKLSRKVFVKTCFNYFKGSIPRKKLVSFFKNKLYQHTHKLIKKKMVLYNDYNNDHVIDEIYEYVCKELKPLKIKRDTIVNYLKKKK